MNENQPLLIYLDTSVISAYFDERTPDRRDETRRFWDFARGYKLVISRLVASEIEDTPGDPKRNQMLDLVQNLSYLPLSPMVDQVAVDFASEGLVPAKKLDDARHLALAVVHGVNFLVSWNFKHMVNFRTIGKLPMLAAKNGYFKPLSIVTPEFFVNAMGQEGNK